MKNNKAVGPVAFASVLALVSSAAMIDTADAAIYVKLDDIKGESTSEKYKDHIEILSWSWGASAQPNGRKAPAFCISELELTKQMDASSAPLVQRMSDRGFLDGVTLIATQSSAEREFPYLELRLGPETIISEYLVSHDEEGRPEETMKLTFSDLEGRYFRFDTEGKIVGEQRFFTDQGYCE